MNHMVGSQTRLHFLPRESGRPSMTVDPQDPVVLAVVPSEIESALIAEALHEANIEAEVTDTASSLFRVASPEGVQILVKQGDLERAKRELERIRDEASHIDWSKVSIGEPDPNA